MTIIEMHKLCDIILDKNDAPWFNPEEKDEWIKLAELEFVKNKVETYEVDEKGRKDLLTLALSTTVSNASSINMSVAPLDQLMYTTQVVGVFKDSCNNKDYTRAIAPVQLDDEAELKNDPFYSLDDDMPGYIETYENGFRELIIKSSTVPVSVTMRYIKKPRPVLNDIITPANNINSELPDHVHDEIINIATRKMLGSIQDQFQYQVQQNEESKT